MGIGDCRLEEISTQLQALSPGKTGETYVTEADSSGYLIGTSTGVVFEGTRLTPESSNSSVVRGSYGYLVDNYGDTTTTLANVNVTHKGSIMKRNHPTGCKMSLLQVMKWLQ